jgi:hypothetical protein
VVKQRRRCRGQFPAGRRRTWGVPKRGTYSGFLCLHDVVLLPMKEGRSPGDIHITTYGVGRIVILLCIPQEPEMSARAIGRGITSHGLWRHLSSAGQTVYILQKPHGIHSVASRRAGNYEIRASLFTFSGFNIYLSLNV